MQKINSSKTVWQEALMNAVTDPAELLSLLQLDENLLDAARAAAAHFPLKVPRGFVERMQKGDQQDPLLLQILPLGLEEIAVPGYVTDPLNESNANPIPGLLHKYHGRVLMTSVGTCAINCRYCFRRHFPYADNNPGTQGLLRIIDYISKDETIKEVILSGGDPLLASDAQLYQLTQALRTLPQVKRLRIHSRIPIVLPERITAEFLAWISQVPQKTILVVHCNHPQELSPAVSDAMKTLTQAGVTLFNQSVLLKSINDSVETLVELSEALFDMGIQPYYLHTLDKVQGAAHFDVPLSVAQALHWEMTKRLPGFLVPKLVSEKADAPAKVSMVNVDFFTG